MLCARSVVNIITVPAIIIEGRKGELSEPEVSLEYSRLGRCTSELYEAKSPVPSRLISHRSGGSFLLLLKSFLLIGLSATPLKSHPPLSQHTTFFLPLPRFPLFAQVLPGTRSRYKVYSWPQDLSLISKAITGRCLRFHLVTSPHQKIPLRALFISYLPKPNKHHCGKPALASHRSTPSLCSDPSTTLRLGTIYKHDV
jgi:hypothetical protein